MKRHTQFPNTPIIPLMLRLPEPLHTTLTTLARQEYRTLTGQIIFLIEHALRDLNLQDHTRKKEQA